MCRRSRQALEAQLAAISHAARGVQLIASVASRVEGGKDVKARLHEAALNFGEATRQLALASKGESNEKHH